MDSLWDWVILVFWIFVFAMFLMAWFTCFSDLFRDATTSGWGKAIWTLFLIFFPPLAVLIYLVVRGNKMGERALEEQKRIQAQQYAYAQQLVAQQGVAAPAAPAADPHDQIAKAKALLDSGAITQAEYDQLKAKALAA